MKKTVEFEGILSGDWECFCFDVDHENFVKGAGQLPDEFDSKEFEYDNESNRIPLGDVYRLYPNHVFGFQSGQKIRVKVEFEVIEEKGK